MRTSRGGKRETRTVPGIGARLRRARLKAGLTQQKLAGDRYTKAYVSALENGLVNPSMVALEYLASRLGTSASQLIADDEVGWSRLEADLLLASGQWQPAADAYAALLERTIDPLTRADLLRGAAEALASLERSDEAAAMAREAVALYEAAGHESDASIASYWLATALQQQDEVEGSRAIFEALLDKVRSGMPVEREFRQRLLMALSTTDARMGNHEGALARLDDLHALVDEMDDSRRAKYLFELARTYREQGDYEAALRTGYASRALFDAVRAEIEMATLENDLALSHLATGGIDRAVELAESARATFERLGDERLLALAIGTQAQIRAASDDGAGALELARQSLDVAERSGNQQAAVSALLTSARVNASLGHNDAARSAFEGAADIARGLGRPSVLRRALTQWADYLAGSGDHRTAFELTREALGA